MKWYVIALGYATVVIQLLCIIHCVTHEQSENYYVTALGIVLPILYVYYLYKQSIKKEKITIK